MHSIRYSVIKTISGSLLLLVVMFCIAQPVKADINCQASSTHPKVVYSIPLSGSYYAGNEIPVGQVVYRTGMVVTDMIGVECDAPFDVPKQYVITNEPSGASFSLSAYTAASGQIYPTNVPGIGVAIRLGSKTITGSAPLIDGDFQNGAAGSAHTANTYLFADLVKTGPVSTGSVINGSALPTVALNVPSTRGYAGLPINNLFTVSLTGGIEFVTQTCETPDVNVNLGTFDDSDFPNIDSVTSWMNTAIQLKNCPTFSGHFGENHWATSKGGAAPVEDVREATILEVALQPKNGLLSASDRASYAIDPGSDAAGGIGYQVAYNTDLSASGPGPVWHEGDGPFTVTPPADGSANIRIPVFIRYVRKGIITAGKANGSVTFTINYK